MQQLNTTGWMHNRLRMITAMFLTKNLLIDWRWGEKYFMQNLIDGDLAANNGGWQWAASTGTDAVPYFRIFNPISQTEKFDPEYEFIKKYCPEALTKKYVKPIIDLSASRQRAISVYKRVFQHA
jgi:deoxyribodipyrimidine photo-lyase